MKKTLAIVLALAMVLCMIPASFAATTTYENEDGYHLKVWSWQGDNLSTKLGEKPKGNSVTAEYNYEDETADITGQFTADKKMAIVEIQGWNQAFENATDVTVYVDSKKVESNAYADYIYQLNNNFIGWNNWGSNEGSVYFPVELTKAGYTDTFVVELEGKIGDDTIKEATKISVTFKNTAEYKNAKTATISKIESNDKALDAYIVGSKIYLDFAAKDGADWADWYGETVDITFKDNNGKLFDVDTWAYAYEDSNNNPIVLPVGAVEVKGHYGKKLKDSAADYAFHPSASKVTFKLETASNIYETKEYEIVKRFGIQEADPKGIYFAETSKTIKIGEEYTPVVLGVATGKKVNATIETPNDTDRQVIDVDDNVVTGTKEGVAYITAKYEIVLTDKTTKPYEASSMKIVVTAGEVEKPTDGAKYVVTASSLNVRSGAGTGYSKIGSLKNGAIVEVETIANGWAKLANGGYVSAQYLSKVVENGEAVTMYVTCRTLNVRKGPGTSYAKAGTLSRGTAVQVVGMTGSWAKLSNGTYVSANYLSK